MCCPQSSFSRQERVSRGEGGSTRAQCTPHRLPLNRLKSRATLRDAAAAKPVCRTILLQPRPRSSPSLLVSCPPLGDPANHSVPTRERSKSHAWRSKSHAWRSKSHALRRSRLPCLLLPLLLRLFLYSVKGRSMSSGRADGDGRDRGSLG